MKVIYSTQSIPPTITGTAVTIGAFDGLHLGHRALIGEIRSKAQIMGLSCVVITFDKHPASIVRPDSAPKLLTSLDSKIRLIESTGVDILYIIKFDEQRANQKPREFIVSELVERLRVKLVVVGSDFHFGKGREGNLELLGEIGRKYGFGLEALDLIPAGTSNALGVEEQTESISSTRIRRLISDGNVEAASALLGRDHQVEGRVIHGDGIGGSELGCPTANLQVDANILLPKDGIYCGWAQIEDTTIKPMVASIGKRPTFHKNQAESLLEVHIIDFDGDIYDQNLRVSFSKWLRGEIKFPNKELLMGQIRQDIEQARQALMV